MISVATLIVLLAVLTTEIGWLYAADAWPLSLARERPHGRH
jgi:hypothetical protein